MIANAAAGSGDWRVAPMPTYDGGAPVTAESGGSSMAVIKQSKNRPWPRRSCAG